MPTLSTTLGKNMQLKAQFGHKSRPAGGNFGLTARAKCRDELANNLTIMIGQEVFQLLSRMWKSPAVGRWTGTVHIDAAGGVGVA